MASRARSCTRADIEASCTLGEETFPVRVSRLSCDGCQIEADCDWPAECDFLHLTLGDNVEINGCASQAKGRKVDIRFFGQIHPVVVSKFARAA
ncbi:MAG: hypothetical protein H6918_01935 [Sphingomonadaceae bacterium]|nr:hypothetical protein [Sphingomonadaceae bacterium]